MQPRNNFDFLRLLFAIFVIITHSFALSGREECDWFCLITGQEVNLSEFGVKGFFVISGYLVFQSAMRSETFLQYLWKRALRIFPALILVLLISVLVGLLVYDGPKEKYVSQLSTWSYIPNNLSLYFTQYSIEGVFTDNPFSSAINGSLWTLAYEFTLYMFLTPFVIAKPNKVIVTISLTTLVLLLFTGANHFADQLRNNSYLIRFDLLSEVGTYFFMGSLFAGIEIEKSTIGRPTFLIVLAILILSTNLPFGERLRYFLWPLIVVLAGISSTAVLREVRLRLGDISYGVYIYGFPVQQTLEHFFKLETGALVLSSLPIAVVLGCLSWHTVEKRALALKGRRLIWQ